MPSKYILRPRTPAPLIDRFFKRVGRKQANGCILWAGARHQDGYGASLWDHTTKRLVKPHRISYAYFVGPIPAEMLVCHRCDTPLCVNPTHLFLGTTADNIADKVAKGRQARGVSHQWSKLTEADIRAIRGRYAAGGVSQHKLAGEYGVTQAAISLIIVRKNWAHVA